MILEKISSKKIIFSLGLILQTLILFSAIQAELFTFGYSKLRIIFLLLLEVILIISIYIFYRNRYLSLGIFIYLTLLLNFVLTPLSGSEVNYVTLPRNINQNVFIHSDLLSGISSPSHVSTDEKGFRSTKKINYLQKKSEYRIFAIGASTTEQIFLDDKKTWTAQLQNELININKHVEVINTGVSGLRAKQNYYSALEILKYSPDVLIFMLGINDWNKDIVAKLDGEKFIRVNFEITSSPLFKSIVVIRNIIQSNLSKSMPVDIHEYGEYYAKQNNSLENRPIKAVSMQSVSKDYEYWVNKIFNLCEEKNLKCMFINQATAYSKDLRSDLKKRLWMTPPERNYSLELDNLISISAVYNSWLIRSAASKGFYVCDISNGLSPSLENFYDDCHFNEAGAKKVAKLLSKCISPLLQ